MHATGSSPINIILTIPAEVSLTESAKLSLVIVLETNEIPVSSAPTARSAQARVRFLLETEDAEQTAARLSSQGFSLRAGLHCAPLAHESAGTLSSGTVRASFSVFNTAREVRALAQSLMS